MSLNPKQLAPPSYDATRMRQWVLSLPFPLRFLLAKDPQVLTHVLGIVYRAIASHILEQARPTHAADHTGAVTLIQRFGSALNLHFHMMFLDGAYLSGTTPPVFRRIGAPSVSSLHTLIERIAQRIARALERRGLLIRDSDHSFLNLEEAHSGTMDDLLAHSITYRVEMGPRAGQKVLTLQTLPAAPPSEQSNTLAQACGFSLHAGIATEPDARCKLERLCRYVSRPAVAEQRLALTSHGEVLLKLKTPYRDGTTHLRLQPLDFLARLAALVPPPRCHLTRYHGVFAPHHALRTAITPAARGRRANQEPNPHPLAKHVRMSWMQRLKRVFAIDIECCRRCGGTLRVIARIEDPLLIERILSQRQPPSANHSPHSTFAARAPPTTASLF